MQAYADFRAFGVFPFAGGSFDQPAELMDELRLVAATAAPAEKQRAEREAKAARRKARTR